MTKLVFLCVVVTALLLQAGSLCLAGSPSFTCTAAETGGAWSEEATWVDCPSGVPDVNDTVLISGPTTVVTIASGESVTVVHLEVNNAATLASRGSLNAVYVEVDEAKLTSTGKITLMDSDEDTYGYDTGFEAYHSDVQISRDLTISGNDAYIYVESSDVTIGGTVNVTCSDGDNAEVSFYESRLSVAGDFVINGGLVNYDFKREEKPKRSTEKRGWFGGLDGSYLQSYFNSIEIKGDLSITSRDHTGNTTDEYTSTGTVNLAVFGGQIVVGGDVLIKSGDALVAETGDAIVAGPFPALALISAPSYIMSEAPSSLLVVGGSVTVESGSVTGLRNDSNDGNQAGSAMFDLLKIDAYINGSASSLAVHSGSAGSSTGEYGGSASEAYLTIGGGSRLVVTNDVVVQCGNGGNGDYYGDHGGVATAGVIFGGEMLVGGEMRVVGGNGGNASNEDSESGEGGAAMLAMVNGGSVNVAGDLLVSSGSSGISTRGAAAYEANVLMSTSSFAETTSVPMPFAARLASLDTRGFPSDSGRYSATGASNLRVGGDLNIIGGSAGSSSYSGASGGSCEAQLSSPSINENVGGLILDNVWDGEVIVGGDVNVRGCDGGDSSDSSGGDTVPIGILASGGVSLAVYGSVNVQAGSGGSSMSSSRGGNGNAAFVVALVSSDINVAGSLTTVAGNGGDVTNNTGEPGYVNSGLNGLFVYSNSHVNVQGAVTVNGGRGGNVNTDGSNWYSGGSAAEVSVTVYDRASLVADSVRVELGTTGNATSSDSSDVEKRNKESSTSNNQESQRRSKLSQLAEKLNLEIKVDKRGTPFSETSGVWVGYSSSITTNGDVAIVAGPTSFSTYAEPASGKPASFGLSTFSTATIRGDVSVIAESGGSTLADTSLDTGSTAEIYVGDESVFKARGNVLLQGGDACTGPNSTTGVQGVAYFELTDGAQFYQSGLFVLRDGKGDNQTDPETSTGIYLVRSEWTVYPCDGAGVEMTQRNSTYFQMTNFATFKDCRGSGARQRYPEPTSDGSADASCSPCSCQEEALSSCPDQSSAAHLHANSVVAWLLATVLQW